MSVVKIPVPSVPLQNLERRFIQRTFIRNGGVPFHVANGSHARNRGCNSRWTDGETQSNLRQRIARDAEIAFDRRNVLHHLLLPVPGEIIRSKISRLKRALFVDRSREA